MDIAHAYRPAAVEKHLALRAAIAELPQAVLIDPLRLHQVVDNLVGNAVGQRRVEGELGVVGAGQAFDLILTARTVDADEALRLGLVSRLADDVVAEGLAIAETLCGYGKFGVESTKQVLWANLEASSLQAALHVENRSQMLAASAHIDFAAKAFGDR